MQMLKNYWRLPSPQLASGDYLLLCTNVPVSAFAANIAYNQLSHKCTLSRNLFLRSGHKTTHLCFVEFFCFWYSEDRKNTSSIIEYEFLYIFEAACALYSFWPLFGCYYPVSLVTANNSNNFKIVWEQFSNTAVLLTDIGELLGLFSVLCLSWHTTTQQIS